MTVILYTIGCPSCKFLESELNNKHIEYIKLEDKQSLRKLGITTLPMLEVDGRKMTYKDALVWLKSI